MYLIFTTKTTGLPQDWDAPLTDFDNWSRMVELAWQIHDENGELIEVKDFIIKPEGYMIPQITEKIIEISNERATDEGMPLDYVLNEFIQALSKSKYIVSHSVTFDVNIVACEYLRKGIESPLQSIPTVDTKDESTDYCKIPGNSARKFKWPTLTELYTNLFDNGFESNNASADVEATAKVFFKLIRIGVITV